jgi:RNA polymerase sigma-70 factor (ECF subfamily)
MPPGSSHERPDDGQLAAGITQTEYFVQEIAEHQNRIYGYIFSMLGDHTATSDVVQETNLVLWRKKDRFKTGAAFLPWAFAIARLQVLAYVRDRKRSRQVLDAELIELISDETQQQATQIDGVRLALRSCLSELSSRNRDLIQTRYFQSTPVADVALKFDRGVSDIKVTLMRLRRKLRECVERHLVGEV